MLILFMVRGCICVQAAADDEMHMRRSLLQGLANVDDADEFSKASDGRGAADVGDVEAPFAVLMDLGSARAARMTIRGRQHALEVQEEAERYTSPLYRPPELWDVASDALIVRASCPRLRHDPPQSHSADQGAHKIACLRTLAASEAVLLLDAGHMGGTEPTKRPVSLRGVEMAWGWQDERVDVWALGCMLYAIMYRQSPFESTTERVGGSVALAVINGRVHWPRDPRLCYPQPLHQLVSDMLQVCDRSFLVTFTSWHSRLGWRRAATRTLYAHSLGQVRLTDVRTQADPQQRPTVSVMRTRVAALRRQPWLNDHTSGDLRLQPSAAVPVTPRATTAAAATAFTDATGVLWTPFSDPATPSSTRV
jgi:serine/threonine protein kinase